MVFDPQDRHEEEKIKAQAKKAEWVDKAVKQQIKDGDFADEMFRALESLTHNDEKISMLVKDAMTTNNTAALGLTLLAQLHIECVDSQEAKYDSKMNTQ